MLHAQIKEIHIFVTLNAEYSAGWNVNVLRLVSEDALPRAEV